MKTVDQLGISPMPWEQYDGLLIGDANHELISESTQRNMSDARLIAAAPELYDCLREAVNNECRSCPSNVHGVCKDIDSSDDDVLCFVKRWRKAIAKAGGEEAK